MYTVFEVDYYGRCHKIGQTQDMKQAERIERKGFKKRKNEYPVFIENGKQVVFNLK